MKIERHIYGSVHGYETLARSSGITDADAKVLEGVSAGAPANAALLGALRASPAYVVSSLGQYRALTRISEGLPDDQGRPTLRQVTLALAKPDWNGVLRGDILCLARRQDVWEWNGESVVQPHEIGAAGSTRAVAPPGSVDKILAILSLLERTSSTGRPVLVRQEDLTLDEFALIERLLPPAARGSLTLAYRGFGTGLRASLICLAHESSGMQRDGLYRPGQLVELSPYAAALAQAGFKLGHIPEEFVRSYSGFGKSSKSQVSAPLPGSRLSPADFPPQVIVTRTPAGLITGFMVACILLPVIAGFVTWWLTKRSAEQVRRTEVAALTDTHVREVKDYRAKMDKAEQHESVATQAVGKNFSAEVAGLRKIAEDRARQRASLQEERIKETVEDINRMQTLRFPLLPLRQRGVLSNLCQEMARRLPEGSAARAEAIRLADDMKQWKAQIDELERTLGDTTQQGPSVQDAQKKLRGLLTTDPAILNDYMQSLRIASRLATLEHVLTSAPTDLSASPVTPGDKEGQRLADSRRTAVAGSANGSGESRQEPPKQGENNVGPPLGADHQPPILPNVTTVTSTYIANIKELVGSLETLRKSLEKIDIAINLKNSGGKDIVSAAITTAQRDLEIWSEKLKRFRANSWVLSPQDIDIGIEVFDREIHPKGQLQGN